MSARSSAQVLVRVSPRLLSDVLCRVLQQQGLATYVCPEEDRRAAVRERRHFDVAVVTVAVDLPADAVADEVIRIDEHGAPVGAAAAAGGQAPGIQPLLAALRRALQGGEAS